MKNKRLKREINRVTVWSGREFSIKDLRGQTKRNLELGPKEFITELERKLGRQIQAKLMGRPKKNEK